MNAILHRPVSIKISPRYFRSESTPTKSPSAYLARSEDFVHSFYAVLRRWESETKFTSNPDEITAHPSFVALVENAGKVIPYIKLELSRKPSHLVWVLEDYFDEKPYYKGEIGDIRSMTNAWLLYLDRRG